MQRRKFIAGVGSLAAAGAAGIGTGAFSSMSASRSADVNVVNDADGLIALQPGSGADGRVETNNGQLQIDFTSTQGAGGVNVNSRYQVGTFSAVNKNFARPDGYLEGTTSNVVPDPAFEIVNQDTVNHVIDISYETNQSDIGGARMFWQFEDEARQYKIDLSGTNSSGSVSVDGKGADPAPEPGDAVKAVLFVDTRDYTGDPSNLDLSGTLTVSSD